MVFGFMERVFKSGNEAIDIEELEMMKERVSGGIKEMEMNVKRWWV